MKADQPLPTQLLWLWLSVVALVPSALGQGAAYTEYRNAWLPRSTVKTNLTPVSTLGFGGSDFNIANASRCAPTNKAANLRINRSRFAVTCGSVEANYNLGQVLPAPNGADTTRQPEIVGEGTNRVAWIGYAQELFAIDQGAVTVNWYMQGTSAKQSLTYRISDYPAGRPVRLYWTEPPYNAPTVALPNAPILPTIYYNNQIADTSMVWLDSANGLHATNGVRGQFLLAYSSKDENAVEHLQGTEIVEVLEPLVTVQSVGIGERLLPASVAEYGTEDLTTQVMRGLPEPGDDDPSDDFLYQHTQGRQNGWLYAIRKTDAPWQVEVYWMAKSLLDVIWPFEVDHYEIDWAADTQLYVRGAPETGNLGATVLFPDDIGVELMNYQDPPDHAQLVGQGLYTSQPGFCLLKYVQDEEVAFDAVHSVYNTDPDYFDLYDWEWDIGRELEPQLPKAHGALDGRGGYVSVPSAAAFSTNVANAKALTLEAWVSPRSAGNQTIVAKGASGYSLSLQSDAEDFEDGVGTEWSTNVTDGSVAAFTRFLGRFSNGSATLTVPTVVGQAYTLTFDLMILDSWDGNSTTSGVGPDYFNVDIAGTQVFHYTFSYTGSSQTYPRTASVSGKNFGWGSWNDSIYRQVQLSFTASGTSTAIRFYDGGLTGLSDESWGLDNVRVEEGTGLEATRLCYATGGSTNTLYYSTGRVPTDRWSHVAVTVQNGPPGAVRFYINGFAAGEVNQTTAIATSSTSSDALTVGNQLGTQFDGGLDEVRVWAAALPAQSVADWMGYALAPDHPFYSDLVGEFRFEEQAGAGTLGTGPKGEVYAGTLTGNVGWQGSGARLYQDESITTEYHQWPGYIQFTTGDRYNVNLYSYPTKATSTPLLSQLFPVNSGRLEVWWANPTRCGLEVPIYWPSLVNLYTNRWPAAPPTIVIASELGNESANLQYEGATALLFNGTANYLQAPDAASLKLTDTFTLECWVRPTSTTATLPIVSKGSDEYTFMISASKLQFYDSTSAKSYTSTGGVAANVWSHVAVTYAAGAKGLCFYINGQSAGQLDLPTAGLRSGTGVLYIGRRVSGSTYFAGLMDEMRSWGRVLTTTEIQQSMYAAADRDDTYLHACYHFDAGDIVDGILLDSSGYANHATAVSAPAEWSPGIGWVQPGQSFTQQQPLVYYQNDDNLPGYNPNEEHALVIGDRVYALRDDFNTTTEPAYVLVQYAPPESSPRQAMAVFAVRHTNEIYAFHKDIVAGSMIQPPLPLSVMSPSNCPENYFINQTYEAAWRDRKAYTWARNAADDGVSTASITMKYFYPVEEGFFFPGLTSSPAVGDHIPWLSGPNVDQAPRDYLYTVRWPDSAPVLHVVGTLIEARDGLPAIRGQKSVDIVYQQSLKLHNQKSVELIDPTRARMASLSAVPGGLQSYLDPATGYTYFSDLPPDLRERMYWNPTAVPGQELQLIGQYLEMTDTRYNYLQLNVLTSSNRLAALNLPGADSAWITAVSALPQDPVILNDDETPFDSIALSAGIGKGVGYVSLVFNNSENRDMVEERHVIDLKIIRVDLPKYVGQLDPILSANPLDQQMNFRYTADFAGKPELYDFQWQYAPGSSPNSWQSLAPVTQGLDYITIGDAGIFGLSDHWVRCAYRARDPAVQQVVGTDWSAYTDPALAEGWIKRVLKAINPYEQRIKDFQQGLLTTLDMIAQAGPPYIGDVPLNTDALNQNGLIQIYETVLEKGKKLSIDYGINDPDANQALLLAAGRISDLYMLLGNEAYADALDPTIGLGTSDPVRGGLAPSIYCFMNQVPTLLDEELALLRGRDGSQLPRTDTYPVENRLFWNYTMDIVGGEVAYALNYDLRDANGELDGFIDATDAQVLYPQGHGDAWGHYLTAIEGYYTLLHSTNFVWIPQSEAVNVGDVAVGVSYLHEQRFAQSAVARARTGALIVSDTYRNLYAGEGADTWQVMRDSDTNRCWGVAEWASRAGQGAYFDWVVANALLPDHDPDPAHTGISRIDRQTVPELPEITAYYQAMQQQVDEADGGLNPLGLASGVVPFDISPADVDAGLTHFEQIYDRALEAWRNALAVFDHVRFNAQALRNQAESQETFSQSVADAEVNYNNQLIEIYGYPYADDLGPGRPYPQDYQGPDLVHYNYVDLEDLTELAEVGRTITLTVTNLTLVEHGEHREIETETNAVDFYVGSGGLPSKPPSYTGQRRAEGRIQMALKDYVRALSEMQRTLAEYHHLNEEIETHFELLEQKSETFSEIQTTMLETEEYVAEQHTSQIVAKAYGVEAEVAAEGAAKIGEAMAEEIPKSIWEIFSIPHGLPKWAGAILYGVIGSTRPMWESLELTAELNAEEKEKESEREIKELEHNLELEDDLGELRLLFNSQEAKGQELQSLIEAADQARMAYASVLAEGQRLQVALQTFRMHTAGPLQANRYRDMAFRIFRNDALQRYDAAFDLAARYVYLAAKAYDYETALPIGTNSTLSSRNLMSQIVRARALGRCTLVNESFNLPEPLAGGLSGDPGLADVLARLKANWGVLKGRYGFNNPDTETGRFSLRTELFRIPPGPDGDADWRARLAQCTVTNLLTVPEFKRYCLPFATPASAEPALMIPFQSTIEFGKNFFGLDLAAGDNAYDSTHFATKIRSVGVWFDNFNNAFNVSTNAGGGLANMPRVYLIPVGLDMARVPSDDNATVRSWTVFDQALPVPYPLTTQDLMNPNWVPIQDSLGGGFGTLRKHAALRAYHDAGFDLSEMTYSSRLIGRSVWNTQWLLIVPGRTLLSDGTKGIQRFIHGKETAPNTWDENGVKDIRLFFQTYAYAGN